MPKRVITMAETRSLEELPGKAPPCRAPVSFRPMVEPARHRFSTQGSTLISITEIVSSVLLVVVAAVWLQRMNPLPHPSFDPQFASVVDCMESGLCHTIGLPSVNSTVVLFEGAVWQDFLIFVRLLGGAANLALTLIIVLMAAGIGLVFLATARLFEPAAALAAAIVSLALLSTSDYGGQFIDTSLMFFLSTMVALCLTLFGLSGRLGALAIAAMFTALAFSDHVSAVCLVPSLLVMATMAGRSPIPAVAVSLGGFFGATYITSAFALARNTESLGSTWISLGIIACFVLGFGSRSAYARQSRSGKGVLVAAILLAPWGTGLLFLVARQQHLDGRYIQTVIAPAATTGAVLVARMVGRVSRRAPLRWATFLIPTVLSLGFLQWMALPASPQQGAWTFDDGEKIGSWLAQQGWNYSSLYERLQGPKCRDLRLSLAPFSPMGPEREDGKQVRVWLSRAGSKRPVFDDAATIELGQNRVAVITQIDSWIDASGSLLCRGGLTGDADSMCWQPKATDGFGPHAMRADRVIQELMGQMPTHGPLRLTYVIPMRPGVGESRDFAALDSSRSSCTQIIAAEGVDVDRPLPGRQVRLYSRDGAPARLAVRSIVNTPECPGDERPPCLLESKPEEIGFLPPVSAEGIAGQDASQPLPAALISDPWPKRLEPNAAPPGSNPSEYGLAQEGRRRMLGGVFFFVAFVVIGFNYALIGVLRAPPLERQEKSPSRPQTASGSTAVP